MSADIDLDDELVLIDDDPSTPAETVGEPWNVLIVDDEPEVHHVTRLALGDVRFRGRPLRFISAHTAAETRQALDASADVALILLDVVMEAEDTGFTIIRMIREEMRNHLTRIILRTGQPGQAPERDIVLGFDINDYKAKTELSAQKLFTTVIAALRSYEQLVILEQQAQEIEGDRAGIEHILEVATELLRRRTAEHLAEGIIDELRRYAPNQDISFLLAFSDTGSLRELTVTGGCGVFADCVGRPLVELLPEPAVGDIAECVGNGMTMFRDDTIVIPLRALAHGVGVVYGLNAGAISTKNQRLMRMFCNKATVGFDSLMLYRQLENSYRATIYALGKVAEYRDETTGQHVRRVEWLSTSIAVQLRESGHFPDVIDDLFVSRIGFASILHDVGKIGISDRVLRKAGPLEADELRLVREHVRIGREILEETAQLIPHAPYFVMGAEIAATHHEWWNGNGYPHGLKGEEIPLAGRIVAVADVFDALLHARPYKPAWPIGKALEHMRSLAGVQFDPRVVEALVTVIASIAPDGFGQD